MAEYPEDIESNGSQQTMQRKRKERRHPSGRDPRDGVLARTDLPFLPDSTFSSKMWLKVKVGSLEAKGSASRKRKRAMWVGGMSTWRSKEEGRREKKLSSRFRSSPNPHPAPSFRTRGSRSKSPSDERHGPEDELWILSRGV